MTLPAATGYGWNGSRYFDLETGRFVSHAAIQEGLESVMDLSALKMNAATQSLIDGNISLAGWQAEMMQQIKLAHTAAASLANGGFAQMTSVEWGATGQMIREQYAYLRNFANEIASGKQPLDGRALVRSDLYGDAANTTYSAMRTRLFVADGWEEEKRELEQGADHCDSCLDYAAQDWQPIDSLPEPGDDSECQKRCRCTKKFRRRTESGEWEETE